MRHEAGHAFNYAYKLYETEEWHELFGPYSRPYCEDYQPNPFIPSPVTSFAIFPVGMHKNIPMRILPKPLPFGLPQILIGENSIKTGDVIKGFCM